MLPYACNLPHSTALGGLHLESCDCVTLYINFIYVVGVFYIGHQIPLCRPGQDEKLVDDIKPANDLSLQATTKYIHGILWTPFVLLTRNCMECYLRLNRKWS